MEKINKLIADERPTARPTKRARLGFKKSGLM